jgi:hypothetical protein
MTFFKRLQSIRLFKKSHSYAVLGNILIPKYTSNFYGKANMMKVMLAVNIEDQKQNCFARSKLKTSLTADFKYGIKL